MRHGESKANIEEKIISQASSSREDLYGLTKAGKLQVIEAATKSSLDKEIIIYSSDYKRAKETAELVQQTLNATVMRLSSNLRERDFGKWDTKSTENYKMLWKNDDEEKSNPSVETPEHVMSRTTQLVSELEEEYHGKDILFVAHGDTLQILQCGFDRIKPSQHRRLPPMGLAEIRYVKLKTG